MYFKKHMVRFFYFHFQMETAPRREVGECIYLDARNQHGKEITCELRVLEELHHVFNPEMAYASYIPFYCLIGKPLFSEMGKDHGYLVFNFLMN